MRIAGLILKIIILVAVVYAVLWPICIGVAYLLGKVSGQGAAPSANLTGVLFSTLAYSVATSLVCAFIHTILAFGLAYGFARGSFPLKEELKTLIFFCLFIPASVIIGPLFWLISKMGLWGGFASVFLAMWQLPWLTLILYLYLSRLPDRLESWGAIDGLSLKEIFTRLVLPYSYKGLIATFLLAFLVDYHSLYIAATAIPRVNLNLPLSTSFSYLPNLVFLIRNNTGDANSALILKAMLIFQIPTLVVLPVLISYGVPVVRVLMTGKFNVRGRKNL